MTDDADDAFATLVATMDTAMVVVTVATGHEHDGCLVGFHSQCSIDPPRYAVWLSKANRTFELAQRATHLAVHALTVADQAMAERFGGQTGDEVDKLADLAWTPGPGGAPLLAACPHRFVGRIAARQEVGGDHVAHILETVVAGSSGAVTPLRLSGASDIDPGHAADDRR